MSPEPTLPGSPKSDIERIQEERSRIRMSETALEKLKREVGAMKPPKSDLQRLREGRDASWVARSFGLHPDGVGGFIKPGLAGLAGSKELVARALAPRDPDEVRRWARQIHDKPEHYEKLVGFVVGPTLAATLMEQFLAVQADERQLAAQTQTIATQAAAVVLEEPTLESAYQALNRFLRNLDPVKQFILLAFVMPLLTSLVSDHLNPAVRRVWSGSPQGMQKEANNQVVAAVGGTSSLVDYRLVVAKTLAVRASPKAAGKKVASLEFGTPVKILRIEGAFALVEWKGGGGVVITGWVFKRYLKPFR